MAPPRQGSPTLRPERVEEGAVGAGVPAFDVDPRLPVPVVLADAPDAGIAPQSDRPLHYSHARLLLTDGCTP